VFLSWAMTSGKIFIGFIKPIPSVLLRPDYGKLSILRQLFPNVPIMALSATCPPKVLQDLITNLRLRPVVDGTGTHI
jgi:hypothetical protein